MLKQFTSNDVEILVHASAPSRGLDDMRWRESVYSLINFDPISRRRLDLREPLTRVFDITNDHLEISQNASDEPRSELSFRHDQNEDEDKKSLRMESSSAFIIQSSLGELSDNLKTPLLSSNVFMKDNEGPSSGSHAEFWEHVEHCQDPASIIPDSQPENCNQFGQTYTPAVGLEQHDIESVSLSSDTSTETTHGRYNPILERPLIGSVKDSDMITKRPICSSVGACYRQFSERSASGVKRKYGDASLESQHAQATYSDSFPSNRIISLSTHPGVNRVWHPNPHQNFLSPIMSQESTFNESQNYSWSCALDIRPALPKTGTLELTSESLITPYLHHLVNRMGMHQHYRPREQIRNIRPMERGYWLVNWRDWGESTRKKYWHCLGKYIAEDNSAGWGVWCVRDVSNEEMRVYCWGAILGHIYLLLIMASEGTIKRTGACWIDGEGISILTTKL